MWNKSHLPEEMRSAVQARLPKQAFLKRDRGNGLFVSNALVFDAEIREIPGFHVECAGKLIRIFPDIVWIRKLEEEYADAQDDLSASLVRFKGAEISEEAMALFCTGVKLLDAGEGALPGEIVQFDRSVRQLAARTLRKDVSSGGLYALSLLDGMLKK